MKIEYRINKENYQIYYLNNKLSQITNDLEKMKSDKKILFLFDKNINKKIRSEIYSELKLSGCNIFEIEFIGSKKNKNLKAVLKIIDFMISKGFTRKSIVLSMGGGVLGDLSALAASLYMRGMIYLHIPTTMTSIVDSCIGGKTAINYQNIINSIGTYFHANKVYILDKIIKNLPEREYISGIPEVLKCGLIKDTKILNFLENESFKIKKKKSEIVKDLCLRSLKTKIHFFKDDVYEKKNRLMLNFGHTFAHSIEMAIDKNITNEKELLRHGEAVGIGILCELEYASQNSKLIKKTKEILNLYNLPIDLKHLNLNKQKLQNDIFKFLFLDKKRINKYPRYINLQNVGKPKIEEMQDYNKINIIINNIL